MTSTRVPRDGRAEQAEELFGRFLAAHDGRTDELSALYREHPDLEEELKSVEREHSIAKFTSC